MTSVRRIVPIVILSAVEAVMAHAAHAQRVFGRVTEADGRTGIAGAVVTLVQDSARATPVLSGAEGRYLLRAPAAGRWQVRADAIGRPSQISRVLMLGANDTTRVELRFPPYVPTLAMVRVAADRSCLLRPDDGERMAEVWQAIRTALEASAATERERRTPLELEVTDYRLDVFKQRTAAMKLTLRSWSGAGFLSAPAEELVVKGYVRQVGDSVAYFAPDASVITSESFLATHCFRVEERAPLFGVRQVGLSFQPLRERTVGDVRGTLWLDAQSSALRKLELEYVVPGRTSSLPNADATMEFSRLPNGRWFVSRWMLNMPVVREVGAAVGGVSTVQFSGWRAREGLARAISMRDAQRMAPAAVIMGRAVDSTTGQPMVGAMVTLEGVGQTKTDSLGGFAFTMRDPLAVPVPAMLSLGTPRAGEVGIEAPAREVTVVAGDTVSADLAIPSRQQLHRRVCAGRQRTSDKLGALIVTFLDEDGTPFRSTVGMMAEWSTDTNIDTTGGAGFSVDGYDGQSLRPDGNGRFSICGVPTGVRVNVIVQWGNNRSLIRVLQAGRSLFTEVRLQAPPLSPREP